MTRARAAAALTVLALLLAACNGSDAEGNTTPGVIQPPRMKHRARMEAAGWRDIGRISDEGIQFTPRLCACGEPGTVGVVHRAAGPCYIDAEVVAGDA